MINTYKIHSKINKILVMHTGGWIGDMILLTPALHAIRDQFPHANISMLVLPLVQELMERNPYIDEVIIYDKHNTNKGMRQMMKIGNQLKSRQFDISVILHPNSISSIFLSHIARIPKCIYGKNILMKRAKKIHEVKRYLNIVSSIANTENYDQLEFWGITEDEINFAKNIINIQNNPIIGINISTTWHSKQWEIENFTRLIELLIKQFDAKILLTGGKDDIALGNKVLSKILAKENLPEYKDGSILNLVGITTIIQLGAIIKCCDLYITADSGPMHISAALGVPTIALFGPTDPARHGPYGKNNMVIKKDMSCSPCYKRECKMKSNACMKVIRPEDVFESVKRYTGLRTLFQTQKT
ncbi:MAG: lipopolysaccharide heptosyltransferase II [bacterium]